MSVPASSTTNFNITFTAGSDTNFSTHNVKACTNINCATGCVGSGTSVSSPATISATALTVNTFSANTTLYALWSLDCAGLADGTWIKVPGDSIYGTSDFCVQKYIPSNNGSNVATSQTATTPWVSISQTTAISTCSALGSGYHLITNPEWMTIGANLANVGSNWSGGTVGSGALRRGHSDNNPPLLNLTSYPSIVPSPGGTTFGTPLKGLAKFIPEQTVAVVRCCGGRTGATARLQACSPLFCSALPQTCSCTSAPGARGSLLESNSVEEQAAKLGDGLRAPLL